MTLACALLVTVSLGSEQKRIRPLSRDAVAQTWIGISEDELYLFRLVLSPDGTGRGAYVFGDDAPRSFAIASWTYDSKRVSMFADAGGDTERRVTRLDGTLTGVAMDLTVSGDGWSRRLRMRPERGLQDKWEKLKALQAEPPH